jgi:hypothetical protein
MVAASETMSEIEGTLRLLWNNRQHTEFAKVPKAGNKNMEEVAESAVLEG